MNIFFSDRLGFGALEILPMGKTFDSASTPKIIAAVVLLAAALGLIAYFTLGGSSTPVENVTPVDITAQPDMPANRAIAPGAK